MEQFVPGGAGVGGAGGEQLLGDLGEGGLDVPRVHVEGGLADHQGPAAEVLHPEAELLQQGEAGEQGGVLLRVQAAHHGGEEGLGHGVVPRRLHPVKVHPLMGGVLVDEQDLVPLLHDDVGVQHLPGQPPGEDLRFRLRLRLCFRLRRGGGRGHRLPLRYGFRGNCLCCADVFHFFHRVFHRMCNLFCRFRRLLHLALTRGYPVQGGGFVCILRRDRGGGGLGPGRGGDHRLRPPEGVGEDGPAGVGAGGVEHRQGGPELLGRHGLEGGLAGRHRVVGLGPLQHRRRAGVVPLQGGQDGVVHRPEHRALIAELHLGLGRVDVHVHRAALQLQVEDAGGKLAHHLLVFVRLLQGGHHQPGLHLPAVDEEELPVPAGPAAGGLGHIAGDRHILPGAADLGEAQGQLPAQNGVHRRLELPVPGGEQLLLPVPEELHAHLRVGQGHPLDHGKDGGPLGRVLLHKFQPGRGVVEQVPHHHGGAQGTARLLHRSGHAPLQGEGGPQRAVLGAGHHLHPGDGGDGRQGLPPKAQGADGLQVVLGAQLAGGVAEKGGLQLGSRNAAAVVGHPQKCHPPVGDLHRHGGGPRVNGVLHELLGHGGGPLHHLAGGDQIGHMGV